MTKRTTMNGNLWKLLVAIGIAIATCVALVQDIRPDVKANTEHRIKFEEKVSTMETNIALILKKVSE